MGVRACPHDLTPGTSTIEEVQVSPRRIHRACQLSLELLNALFRVNYVGSPVHPSSHGKGCLFSEKLQLSPLFPTVSYIFIEGEGFFFSQLSSRQQMQYSLPWEQPRCSGQQRDCLLLPATPALLTHVFAPIPHKHHKQLQHSEDGAL